MKRITTYWLSLIVLLLLPLGATAQKVILEETFDEITSGSNTKNPRFAMLSRWKGNDNTTLMKNIYQADHAILVGSTSNSAVGYFELKTLDLSGNAGAFDVTLEVKGINTDASGILKVSIVGNDASAQEYTPTKYREDEWETHTFSFSGGQGATVLRIETLNNASADNCKGVFINNLKVTQMQGQPTLVSDVKSVDFRRANIGETAKFQLAFVGTNLATAVKTEITGEGKDAFKIAKDAENVESAGKHTLDLEFTPTAAGKCEATLHITSGDLVLDIPLMGVGVDPANPYGLDPNAKPVESLNEPFTTNPLLSGWREVAFEGDVHWEPRTPYNDEPVMSIEAAGSGQKVRSALITPLVKIPSSGSKVRLMADYRIGFAKGGKFVVKRFSKEGKLIADLKTIEPKEPVDEMAYKFDLLSEAIEADGQDSYFVFEYMGDDSPAIKSESKTLTVLLDNVKLTAEEIPAPVLTTDADKLDFGTVNKDAKVEKPIIVEGEHILSRIKAEIVGDGKDFFEIDKSALPANGGALKVTLKGTKEIAAIEAKLVLTAEGEAKGMSVTKEIPLVGKIVTSTQEILGETAPVRFTAEGLVVVSDATLALYSADGQLILAGSYRAGDQIRIDYTGSVILYVEGVAYKGTLR